MEVWNSDKEYLFLITSHTLFIQGQFSSGSAVIINQFFINQSTIEDNDDVPDVPELLTSINQINLSVEEVKNTLTKLSTAKVTGPDQIHNYYYFFFF